MTASPGKPSRGRRRGGHRRLATFVDRLPLVAIVGLVAAMVAISLLVDVPSIAHDVTQQSNAAMPPPAPSDSATASASASDEASPKAEQTTTTDDVRSGEKALEEGRRRAESLASGDRRQKGPVAAGGIEATGAAEPFQIGSFNVLAIQHTAPGGMKPAKWPTAAWRTPRAIELIRAHGVEVLGLQEVKPAQLDPILNATGFKAYPGYEFGARDTDNSIIYDPKVFEFVSGSSFPITFMSRARPQTVLRLRQIATGREMYFINGHTSAGHDRRNTATRLAGMDTIVAQINRLKAEGLPVFLTGDMNDRAVFFCRVLPPTGMIAAVGGNTAGGCHPPGRMPVDWVIGTPDVAFSGYRLDESSIRRLISDHFFISATATVGAAR